MLLLTILADTFAADQPLLRVGVAQIDITPDYPVRLSGFGFRRAESEGITQNIWAKALAFDDEMAGPIVLITADNLCVPDEITQEIATRLAGKAGLKRERLTITATHTHTAPMLKNVCPTLFGVPIPPEHQTNIDRYTREFIDKLEAVALAAVKDLRPSRVSFGIGSAAFAINRRTKGGPVDHDLPILAVHEPNGNLRAVYFSYACHCVTLSDNKVSGDWAGFAQKAIQDLYPGAIALASVGCGADSNPDSGVTGAKADICADQGNQIAREVKHLLGSKLTPLTVAPTSRYSRLDVAFDTPRSRSEWEERAKREDAVGHHARVTLAKLDRGEKLPAVLNYPIQSWVFGNELAIVFLPGETVVDYSLRLKREFERARLWVNGYSNEGRCYIPSERVLREGGYEGGDAMIYYDFPQRFAPGLEDKIISAVKEQIPASFKAPPGTEGTRPLSPQDALRSFHTKPNHIVELVAAEPLIHDPVAIDWGPDGKLWTCEMHDYPSGTDHNWRPGGRVQFLEDRDGDGQYDKATVFADGLPFPTGIMAWKGGVLICAAPDILFAQDTNGDGKANKIEKLFSGFATDNYQARVNSPTLGLDNWIYAANGLLGGTIAAERNSLFPNQTTQTLDIRNRDIRFSPFTGELQTVSGLTQQGRARDDWGNWFGCDNTRLVLHFPWPERYIRRNPDVPAPNPVRLTTTGPEGNRLFPTSRLQERFNDPDNANRVTSASGLGVYRDTLLGDEYYGNVFTCEAVHNLVHREVLSGDLAFSSARAADEKDSEFLSSSDNWFRPVQVRTGPDGALYVVDMYRFLIEHPRWIPAERLSQIDVRAGADMGRIYRVRARNVSLRKVADLTKLNTPDLASALDSSNGTERDRVHAELLARRDAGAAPALAALAKSARLPQVRSQALAALDGIEKLDVSLVKVALGDRDASVREHALRLAEGFLRATEHKDLLEAVVALKDDPSLRVLRQLAFTLGESRDDRSAKALATIAAGNLANPELRAAVLSSAGPHCGELLEAVLSVADSQPAADEWIGPLVATAAVSKNNSLLARAIKSALPRDGANPSERQFSSLAKLFQALGKDARDHERLLPRGSNEAVRLIGVLEYARKIAVDQKAPESLREIALRFIGATGVTDADLDMFASAASEGSESIRRTAISALRTERSPNVAKYLLELWDRSSPIARGEMIALFLDRPEWSNALLEAVKNGTLRANEISLANRQRLAASEVPSIRNLAAELLPEQGNAARVDVLKRYQTSLSLPGDTARGAQVFAQNCASCHALNGVGHDVGPDLAALRTKDADYWLKNILDPNAIVEPRFVGYQIDLTDDRSLSGVIKNETATGLTIVGGNGVSETVFRSNIRNLRASSLSLMPEGLEEAIQPQQMADLIAFVRAGASMKKVAGNIPATIGAGSDGVFLLPASKAEIFGDQITFESPFKNIGMWHGADDHVVWTVQVEREGNYDLHLDYACPGDSAGNKFQIASGESLVGGTVVATGSDWSQYKQVKIGTLSLKQGLQRITFRPDGAIRNALIDIRTLALARPDKKPRWPDPGPPVGEVLRDPPSVARFILDSSRPNAAREAAVHANPQFSASLISEMTRDLAPGTPEEYARIPWIWRVAIACGKRNDAGQMRAVLAASLPKDQEPLRDWQAVVIGGGIINGISDRGLWPGERVREIIGSSETLAKRWQRSLDLAAAMADDSKIPTGTRYDALRMLGSEPWEKRGEQLVRYLSKQVDGELQMGAVSGLADMNSEHAASTLISALPSLNDHNRKLALDALVRRNDRTPWLLDAIAGARIPRALLDEKHAEELLKHSDGTISSRANELLRE